MPKKKVKAKEGYVICKDCGNEYASGAPHNMFCAAKTCSECGTTYHYVIPIYDSRVKPPLRKCAECLEEEFEEDEDTYEDRVNEDENED